MKTILVIEDNPAIARGLVDLLGGENFKVFSCSMGERGIELATTEIPDAVLLDIGLPDINGFEVLRKIRNAGYQRPVLMLTSRSDRIDKITALESGADDYITKPFDTREVIARLRAHLRQWEHLPAIQAVPGRAEPPRDSERKLLAIMFTDLKDFSKIMNEDEDAAMALLNRHNRIMDNAIPKYHGKIVEIIGDAYLAAFRSSEQAVDCAMNIQRELWSFNEQNPKEPEIVVRIGIHLGDVVEVGDKLRGNAVNVAARIQDIAEPGSVFVSEQIVLASRRKEGLGFVSLGPKKLKNIKEDIHLYRVTTG